MQSLRFVWKIDPYHALQVSDTQQDSRAGLIKGQLDKLDVLAAESDGADMGGGLEGPGAANAP